MGVTMNTIRLIQLVAVMAALSPTAAYSQWNSGNDLQEYCGGEAGSFVSGICSGYIIGTLDTVEGLLEDKKLACVPPGVTKGQVRDIVIKYIEQHPEYRHFVGMNLVVLAVGSAFPC